MLSNRRIGAVLCAIFLLARPASAAEIQLSAHQVFSVWQSINNALVATAKTNALDDEWATKFATMPPPVVSGADLATTAGAIAKFSEQVSPFLVSTKGKPLAIASDKDGIGFAELYTRSGEVMDALAAMFLRADPFSATVAHYYDVRGGEGKTLNDVVSMIGLASQRLQAYQKEIGY